MPIAQFSLPSGVYLRLGALASEINMSPELFAKYALWYVLMNGITPDQIREAQRDYERKSSSGEKVMHKPKAFGAF